MARKILGHNVGAPSSGLQTRKATTTSEGMAKAQLGGPQAVSNRNPNPSKRAR